MKKILNIFYVGILSVLLLASCDKDFDNVMDKEEGSLSLKNFEVSVHNAEDVIESRSSSVNVNTFQVTIVNKSTGEEAGTWTYGSLPEIVMLNEGSYTVKVKNQELEDAEWDSPYFYGEQDFTIKKNDVTEVEPIVCKLSNLKVSIKYSDELKSVIGSGDDILVDVTVGENSSLDFVYNETRSGYFRCDSENKSLVATFSGTVEGYYISEYKVISDVAAGQHRIITFSLKTAPDVSDEYGAIGTTGLSLNASVKTVDLTRDVIVDEEVIEPDDYINLSDSELSFAMDASSKEVSISSSAEWAATSDASWCIVNPATGIKGNNTLTVSVSGNTATSARTATITVNMGSISKEIIVTQAAYSEQPAVAAPTITSSTINLATSNVVTSSSIVDVDVVAPGKIAKFIVTINMSDGNGGTFDLSSVGLTNQFDLCNPGQYKEGLVGLGLPVEDDVKGKDAMKFDISSFMSLLVIYSGDHVFKVDVTDELGQTSSATLNLKVE